MRATLIIGAMPTERSTLPLNGDWMFALTAALITITVLGLCFGSTRKLGILSAAVLCFLFPFAVLTLLLIAGGVGLFLKLQK